jgi:superfamily II DNA/RNA helicase
VPSHAEDYVHRIGRTGRAGRSGTSVTLAARSDAKYVSAIEKLTGEKVELTDIDNSDEIARSRRAMALEDGGQAEAPEQRSRRGRRPRRDAGRPRQAPLPPKDKGHHSPPKTKHDGDRDRDQPVVGMGDHVPDFMRRPVRVDST